MERIFIETYGCTLNQADSDVMESILTEKGYVVERGKTNYKNIGKYDHIIINTCTVKKPTEQKIIDRLEHLTQIKDKLIVTGCLASASPDIIKKAVPHAKILNTKEIVNIYNILNPTSITANSSEKPSLLKPAGLVISRVPISEGCLSNCSFCETKFARGPLKSFDTNVILKAIELSVKSGSKEIELTSQDVGAYGADRKTNIAELVSQASELPGEFIMRIGMLNPEHLHKYLDELILAYKSPKLFKFIHLPIQSGSDSVLKSMKRKYTVDEVREYFKELRKKIKGISITTDIIVGYPSESKNEFIETKALLLELKPTITNISKFWQRAHAPASRLKQLSQNEIKERSTLLSRTVRAMQTKEYSKLIGEEEEVLITENNNGFFSGRDIFYRPIAVTGKELKLGERVNVKIYGNSYACLLSKPYPKDTL